MTSEGKEQIENKPAKTGKSRSARGAYIRLVILLTAEIAFGTWWTIQFMSNGPGWNNNYMGASLAIFIYTDASLAVFIICAIALMFRKVWGFYGLIAQQGFLLYWQSTIMDFNIFLIFSVIVNMTYIGTLIFSIKAAENRLVEENRHRL